MQQKLSRKQWHEKAIATLGIAVQALKESRFALEKSRTEPYQGEKTVAQLHSMAFAVLEQTENTRCETCTLLFTECTCSWNNSEIK